MRRKCKFLMSSPDGKRAMYIDTENEKEIIAYIQKDDRHRKKFLFIAQLILEGHKNCNLYDKEEINDKCKGVTAIKFFKGQENDRLYCKEVMGPKGNNVIVMAILHEKKKSNKLSSKEKSIILNIGGYNYEFF